MEVIELAGYTQEEKREIAKRYLVPRQMERNGLGRSKIEFTDEALDAIIDGYTREAGVRNLEREIGSVCRKVAREFAEGTRTLEARRSARRPSPSCSASRASSPTSSAAPTSRAWPPAWPGRRWAATCCSSRRRAYPGDGKLQITGQLGDVMKESAAAALSYVKTTRPIARRQRARRLVPHARPARARARRRDPQGRARARASRWPRRSPRASAGGPCARTPR